MNFTILSIFFVWKRFVYLNECGSMTNTIVSASLATVDIVVEFARDFNGNILENLSKKTSEKLEGGEIIPQDKKKKIRTEILSNVYGKLFIIIIIILI